ncbi:MAG: hypothetical protein WCK58_05305 [Chloroflexota bacterium]
MTIEPAGGSGPETAEQIGQALAGIVASAARLGVELDQVEAAEWVTALETEAIGGDVVVDVDSGIYGHKVSMLDFSPRDLARFRAIGEVVGFEDRPPEFLTALALSGSAAQGRVQAYPGDCDYFERIHITAPTRADACAILAREMRAKSLATRVGRGWRLWEVKFGSYPFDGERAGHPVKAGTPIAWTADEVATGAIVVILDGQPATITWEDASADPGWCKLDWIVTDPVRLGLANASNMLDVTWEAPDGTITPLDGFVDPYFQEIYLEAESLPLFTKLVKELAADSVDEYVRQLEHEVAKYSGSEPNWGKVARRLYNIFRLTGRYPEAVYLRELFDEPTTILYQVAAHIRTVDEADRPGAEFDVDMMIRQTDAMIMAAVSALEGRTEAEMVRRLLAVRDNLRARLGSGQRSADVDGVKNDALAAVNDYFERRLFEVPSIKAYVDELVARGA